MQNKYIFILLFFFVAVTTSFSQQLPTPMGDGSTERAPNPPGTPIDGGLSLLIAAGAFYGIKKSLKR
ncbi:hypothetical protein FNB79_04350 [Formosa sediminum]|uniref:VPEID-CTERM sorting domain-containing protein n=2 Tax=Formosa sediminum TaxID=2594004 RepID=A0A516GVV8_9FLAO|nr:hypothetical protein FNB79_04350 [Formosa sediminum]